MNFDKTKYKIYTWKNWMMLHWILNPGVAVNELILGQRIPRISLEDKTSDRPRIERSLIPCPHCEKIHDARMWSADNGTAFKNWFGLYCVNCGNTIPCLTNVLSFLVLAVTFPIWGWFRKSIKSKWLEKQPRRFENIDVDRIKNPLRKNLWLKKGLTWGAVMFVLLSVISPYLSSEEITLKSLLISLFIWLIGGIAFGYTLKLFSNHTVRPNNKRYKRQH